MAYGKRGEFQVAEFELPGHALVPPFHYVSQTSSWNYSTCFSIADPPAVSYCANGTLNAAALHQLEERTTSVTRKECAVHFSRGRSCASLLSRVTRHFARWKADRGVLKALSRHLSPTSRRRRALSRHLSPTSRRRRALSRHLSPTSRRRRVEIRGAISSRAWATTRLTCQASYPTMCGARWTTS